jgi:hypothetical protein
LEGINEISLLPGVFAVLIERCHDQKLKKKEVCFSFRYRQRTAMRYPFTRHPRCSLFISDLVLSPVQVRAGMTEMKNTFWILAGIGAVIFIDLLVPVLGPLIGGFVAGFLVKGVS